MDRYSQLGGKLGCYIRATNPSAQQIQAFLGDLLANDELLLVMRDLVARPSFRALADLAGSGTGMVQRDALLQELSRSYLPTVVSDVRYVVTGMLALPTNEESSSGRFSGSYNYKGDVWGTEPVERQQSPGARNGITLNQLADEIKATSSEIIDILFAKGIIATEVQILDREVVKMVLDALCENEDKREARSADLAKEMVNAKKSKEEAKRLAASAICDETLWNRQRDPELDKRFLEAWNLRWFNKRYRPRLTEGPEDIA